MGKLISILTVGIVAGFLNTVAAGGSLLTLPMLIFLGLPAAVANGSNRIGLVFQSMVAVWSFRRKGFFDWKLSILLGIPAVIGSIIGANLAIVTSDELFNKILAGIMLVVLWLTIKPSRKRNETETEVKLSSTRLIIAMILFFFVGIYGGFIQAGVGFFIMGAMSMITRMSLLKINSIKVFVVGLYMIASLVIYIYKGQVNWEMGLTLALGNGIGAWIGSTFAVSKGEKWIKWILALVIVIMAFKLVFIV
jgi:uncharacterized membrane protein YfcA